MTINQIRIRVEERINELDAAIPEYHRKWVQAKEGSTMGEKWHARDIVARQERQALLDTLKVLNEACKTIKY